MDNIAVQHRLIGAEDIDFDVACKDEKTAFLTPFGVTKPLSKLNARHLPLDNESFIRLGQISKNVGSALMQLKVAIDNIQIEAGSGLANDKTVVLGSSDNYQDKINTEKTACNGNLNGKTLTFKFDDNIGVIGLASALELQGFFNGYLVLDLNGNTLNYSASTNAVILLTDCFASILIKGGTLVFNSCIYGILAEGCPVVFCSGMSFETNNPATSYAVYGLGTDVEFASCTVTGCDYYLGGKKENSTWTGKANGMWIAFQDALAGLGGTVDSMLLSINDNTARLDCRADYIVSQGKDDDSGISWIEYKSGRLIQWGICTSEDSDAIRTWTGEGSGSRSQARVSAIDFFKPFKDNEYYFTLNFSSDHPTLVMNLGAPTDVYNWDSGYMYQPVYSFQREVSSGNRAYVVWTRSSSATGSSDYHADKTLFWFAIGTIDPDYATEVIDPGDENG